MGKYDYSSTSTASSEVIHEQRVAAQAREALRERNAALVELDEARGIYNTLKSFIKAGVSVFVVLLGAVVGTWIWCWHGIALHESRGGLTAGITILSSFLLILIAVGVGFAFVGLSGAYEKRRLAQRKYNEVMDVEG